MWLFPCQTAQAFRILSAVVLPALETTRRMCLDADMNSNNTIPTATKLLGHSLERSGACNAGQPEPRPSLLVPAGQALSSWSKSPQGNEPAAVCHHGVKDIEDEERAKDGPIASERSPRLNAALDILIEYLLSHSASGS